MKQILLVLIIFVCASCNTTRKVTSQVREGELINTRRYVGEFIDFRHTGPEIFGNSNLIWIKTTLFSSFGKLSAYGNKCDFSVGDKLYLRRLYSTPDIHGNWTYQIENDSSVVYRVSDYKYENNVLVRASF